MWKSLLPALVGAGLAALVSSPGTARAQTVATFFVVSAPISCADPTDKPTVTAFRDRSAATFVARG